MLFELQCVHRRVQLDYSFEHYKQMHTLLQTIYDPGMVFSVPKEKPIPLVTVSRTTEHVIK